MRIMLRMAAMAALSLGAFAAEARSTPAPGAEVVDGQEAMRRLAAIKAEMDVRTLAVQREFLAYRRPLPIPAIAADPRQSERRMASEADNYNSALRRLQIMTDRGEAYYCVPGAVNVYQQIEAHYRNATAPPSEQSGKP